MHVRYTVSPPCLACSCLRSLQDVILPRVLDDGTFATLSSLMLFNNVEVLMALTQVKKTLRVNINLNPNHNIIARLRQRRARKIMQ